MRASYRSGFETADVSARIIVKNVGLQVPHFVQTERFKRTAHQTLLSAAFTRSRRAMRTLLEGISFEAREGDRIAIMGRNGAGKTTLLRILTGAFQPTTGLLEIRGSRQALLNLGLGFNQEATVRENVYLRAIAMGLRIPEIHALMDPILEFAQLEHVLDHRLLTLSSGQRMRLGFSISTSVKHDIILLDEWLGAGDAGFVQRAKQRMTSHVNGSKIVVLASHNFPLLRKVCNKGLVIDDGKQAYFGPLEDAILAYKKIYQSDPLYVARRAGRAAKKRAKRLAIT
jgi:lipopolysaccharide transport system ATP-binding protein